jgi:hypothetical protein
MSIVRRSVFQPNLSSEIPLYLQNRFRTTLIAAPVGGRVQGRLDIKLNRSPHLKGFLGPGSMLPILQVKRRSILWVSVIAVVYECRRANECLTSKCKRGTELSGPAPASLFLQVPVYKVV